MENQRTLRKVREDELALQDYHPNDVRDLKLVKKEK